MKRTLILRPSTADLSDPLLHALAATMGPAQIVPADNEAALPGDAARLVLFTQSDSDQAQIAARLRQNQSALAEIPAGWIAIGASHPTGEVNRLFSPGRLEILHLTDGAAQAEAQAAIIEFALRQRQRHSPGTSVEASPAQTALETFLRAHNTCTLSTSFQGQVSSRAVEYRYEAGGLHMVSEGGEKFAGLLTHSQVAVCIYEPYKGFGHLAGVQLTGVAAIPAFGSPAHEHTLSLFNLTLERMQRLPAPLHAIVVRPEKAVFLWSGFSEQGLEVRQEFSFARPEGAA